MKSCQVGVNWLQTYFAPASSYLYSQLAAFESLIIEEYALGLDDIYDGLSLPSRSGSLRTFTVNKTGYYLDCGIPFASSETNYLFSNGFLHNLNHFPSCLITWLGKSNYDILLETNENQNGNLSHFVKLVEASDMKELLQTGPGPVTLFVPNNLALATLDPQKLEFEGWIDATSALYQLLLNHVAHGNFATKGWEINPTGIKLSATMLQLGTYANKSLDIEIDTDSFVINQGQAKIIKSDIFSEFGTMHIIDHPLLDPDLVFFD